MTIKYIRSIQLGNGVTRDIFEENGVRINIERQMVEITSKMAAGYLSKNPLNRSISKFRVNFWCKEILAGNWLPINDIIFDTDDKLIDGQHRLNSCAISGSSILCEIKRGVPRNWITAIDNGRARRFQDYARFLGREERQSHLAVARLLEYGVGTPGANEDLVTQTTDGQFKLVEKYWDAVEFAVTHGGHTRGISAVVMCAIARAYYTSDREKLEKFCAVLRTGLSESKGEHAAVKLRDLVRDPEIGVQNKGGRIRLYKETLLALDAFLRGVSRSKKVDFTIGELEKLFPLSFEESP